MGDKLRSAQRWGDERAMQGISARMGEEGICVAVQRGLGIGTHKKSDQISKHIKHIGSPIPLLEKELRNTCTGQQCKSYLL